MSTIHDLKAYRLATLAQWQSGLSSRIGFERVVVHGKPGCHLTPLRPLAPEGVLLGQARESKCITITPFDVLYWRDSKQVLHWVSAAADEALSCSTHAAPCQIRTEAALAHSPRLICGKQWLWCWHPGSQQILRFDMDSLQAVDSITTKPHGIIIDAASDDQDGVWLLLNALNTEQNATQSAPQSKIIHLDQHGRQQIIYATQVAKKDHGHHHLTWCGQAAGLHYLAANHTLALLDTCQQQLVLFHLPPVYIDSKQPSAPILPPLPTTLKLSGQLSGTAFHIDGDGQQRLLLLLNNTDVAQPENTTVALLDQHCGLITQLATGTSVFAGTVRRDQIWLASSRGILRYRQVAQANAGNPEGHYLSAALFSPPNVNLRPWLRAELQAYLPPGASMVVTPYFTDQSTTWEDAPAQTKKTAEAPAQRINNILAKLSKGQSITFVADSINPCDHNDQAHTLSSFEVPLHTITACWLWLSIKLCGTPLGELPKLASCQVLYPEVSLMQYLPAIFRGDVSGHNELRGDPSGFLRNLVHVLETSSQGLDQLIASLGRQIHPDTAPAASLDFLARWLALPWHDSLREAEKRRVLQQGAQILAGRGTRGGLLALFHALMPEVEIKLQDGNVDWGFAVLGGQQCNGSTTVSHTGTALPALLTGLPHDASTLNARARLGVARLPGAQEQVSATRRFTGLLYLTVYARQEQHAVLAQYLPQLVQAMLPIGIQPHITWRNPIPEGYRLRLDEHIRLDNPGPRRLNQDSVLGLLTLHSKTVASIPEMGIYPGFKLA